MRKLLFVLGVIFGALIGLFIFGRLTGFLGFYTVKTESSLPTLQVNSLVLSTHLIKPVNGSIIVFWFTDINYGRQHYIFRQMADEGDVLEIRNGIAYVNSQNIDTSLNLLQYFVVEEKEVDETTVGYIPSDSGRYIVQRETERVRKERLNGKLYVESESFEQLGIAFEGFKSKWSVDNFGPYKVPKGNVFVLADNRHGGRDSRFIGPVSKDSIVGTVFLR